MFLLDVKIFESVLKYIFILLSSIMYNIRFCLLFPAFFRQKKNFRRLTRIFPFILHSISHHKV